MKNILKMDHNTCIKEKNVCLISFTLNRWQTLWQDFLKVLKMDHLITNAMWWGNLKLFFCSNSKPVVYFKIFFFFKKQYYENNLKTVQETWLGIKILGASYSALVSENPSFKSIKHCQEGRVIFRHSPG